MTVAQSGIILLGSVISLTFLLHCEAKGNHPAKADWASFKAFHRKKYDNSTHERFHLGHFQKAALKIAAHNKLFQQGRVKYEKELNRFSDQDPAALKKRRGYKKRTGTKAKVISPQLRGVGVTPISVEDLPDSYDWRDQNAVSVVKDQGNCGNCWAFSATGSLESQVYINSDPKPAPGEMNLFSEQQITDCDHLGDYGCDGGNYETAWDYVKSVGGVESETAYPFTSGPSGKTGNRCLFNSNNELQTLSSYLDLPEDETVIQQYLVTVGPLSISFDASDMDYYSSGIYDCPVNYAVDHSVLLVGYDTDNNGTPYWIVKNQWGAAWGMDGYFYLMRGTGACGVNTNAAYPIL